MTLKNLLIGMSTAGLIAASLSVSACSGGTASPQATVVPSPVAVQITPPNGYSLPTGTTANGSTVYVNNSGATLTDLALPQGLGTSALQISAPGGIALTSLISAFVQQYRNGSSAVALIISSLTNGTLVNVSQSPLTASAAASVKAITSVTWNAYTFDNVSGTSTPVAVAANGGAYIGTNISAGGFLAFQSSVNPANPLTFVAVPSACNLKASSTRAVSIADTILGNNNYIGIGTDQGEVLAYGVSGSNIGQCQNLTAAGKVSIQGYSFGSPVIALSFTGTTSNNYGYFATQNNQIWRVTATTNNSPQDFTQINKSVYSGAPTSGITALYSDSSNRVFVGTTNGTIYLLTPTNSSGNPNMTWTSTQLITSAGLVDTSAVTSISAATDGSTIAVTANNIYNLGII